MIAKLTSYIQTSIRKYEGVHRIWQKKTLFCEKFLKMSCQMTSRKREKVRSKGRIGGKPFEYLPLLPQKAAIILQVNTFSILDLKEVYKLAIYSQCGLFWVTTAKYHHWVNLHHSSQSKYLITNCFLEIYPKTLFLLQIYSTTVFHLFRYN